jgi:NAD-dependent SIR2 family protein deacetylase
LAADYQRCAELIRQADGLLITAGAGIGVDSGLPDFRGPQGFWGVYPALGRARIAFEQIANPAAFARHPRLAWGFYGHRLNLYRRTDPARRLRHPAPDRRRACRRVHSCSPATSTASSRKPGFAAERIAECHGSIHHLQCLDGCHDGIWPADDFQPELDEERACSAPNSRSAPAAGESPGRTS